MKIFTSLNQQKYASVKAQKNQFVPTFGTFDNIDIIPKDPKYRSTMAANYSELFRNKEFWEEFPDFAASKNTNDGVKVIHSAASANGLEAYTAVIELIDKRPDMTNVFFPIKVSDISETSLKAIESREVYISEKEKKNLSEGLKNKNFEDFFEALPTDEIEHAKHIEKSSNYWVKDILYSNIAAEKIDIFEYAKNADNFKGPVIMFLRNCWYEFSDEGKAILAKDLFKNFKPGSNVIIGNVDRIRTPEILTEQGFKKLSQFVFEKPHLNIHV